ncbi:MAG TPA: pantoate--beta-alanine ligase [Rhodanobacteraceae bacterium]|nr:pantoate--beta-alanine ligase [Rhodanobacteraceae bacterium]
MHAKRIALVPTLGNLHAGHYSLVALARKHADVVLATVFVNPTQFGPNEDFARYPRTPDADAKGLAASGCDALFMPAMEEMYPYGPAQTVRVSVPGFEMLEGEVRRGHFDGVATVVAKLFNLVRPDVAIFGRKDYQQLLVIRRLTRDLAYPIEVMDAPTRREANGLAMSSRNQYLDAEQRERGAFIHTTLRRMQAEVSGGTRNLVEIEEEAASRLREMGFVPDYAVIRRAEDLGLPAEGVRRGLIALIAARLGSTRLIDNLLLDE